MLKHLKVNKEGLVTTRGKERGEVRERERERERENRA